jgi:hypothetical protein
VVDGEPFELDVVEPLDNVETAREEPTELLRIVTDCELLEEANEERTLDV